MFKKTLYFFIFIIVASASAYTFSKDTRNKLIKFYNSPFNEEIFSHPYSAKCLTVEAKKKPVFECYEFQVNAEKHQTFTITHESGYTVNTLSFVDNNISKIRFTPTKAGAWSSLGIPLITIDAQRPEYAKGFVQSQGNKWIRSATGNAFIPQYLMYDKTDIKQGIQEFIVEHGFTGFHIYNLRDFLKNPSYFETVILETYRAGGTTHFWLWGDRERRLTPEFYDGSVDQLYKEIMARLGPLPGWTIGYGFDLFEWATTEELNEWKTYWNSLSSYRHLMGGRGFKNEYKQVSSDLDYTSWEWHRPTINDYKEHLEKYPQKPVMSEDRFRIHLITKYPEKDYSEKLTIDGLWNSFFSGGVANIWGRRLFDQYYSSPYTLKSQIKSYHDFVAQYYSLQMTVTSTIKDNVCVNDDTHLICRLKNTEEIKAIRHKINISNIKLLNINNIKEAIPYNEIVQKQKALKGEWIMVAKIRKNS